MKKAVSIASLVTVWLLCGQLGWANNNENNAKSLASAAPPAVKQQRNALREAGFNSLYNIEYKQAEESFAKIAALDPDHPAGYLYQAASLWMRYTHNTRRLQTALFNNSNMQSDIVGSNAPVDETCDKQFRNLLEIARTKAEAMIKASPKDAEAHYFLGGVYGTLAGYEATVSGKTVAAMRAGSKAVEIHRKVLKLDPNFVDAYLSIGIYDYVVANLPLAVRMMGSLFGLRGNEERGLKAIERVAAEGKYAADDARVVLITIYQREKRFDEALKTLNDLHHRYPRNYLLSLQSAALLMRSNRKSEAFENYQHLLCEKAHNPIDLIRFHYGDALLASGKFQEASEQFLAIAKEQSSESHLQTLAHFRAGQALDLAKHRTQAVEQYKQVLQCSNSYNIHERAREYIKKPYER